MSEDIVTLMLKGMDQADAGKVIIKMKRVIDRLDYPQQAETARCTTDQIKAAHRR